MKASTRGKSGARLPLMLLLSFVGLIAGVGVWLTLSFPTPDDTIKTPIKTKNVTTEQKPTNKPETGPTTKLDDKQTENTSKPEHDAAGGAKTPAHGDDADHQSSSTKERNTADPAAGKPPMQSAIASPQIAPKVSLKKLSHPPARMPPKPVATEQSGPSGSTRAFRPRKFQPVPLDAPLSSSPDPALVQMTALGPLPRVSEDGRLPRQVYAKPFNTGDKRPRVAIVVTGLGLSAAATESAIQGLPGSVTLAFAPYSPRLNEWIRLARAAGHEVLINVPMEPTNYPTYKPGPQTLLTTLNAEENLNRLLWNLSRGTGYVGVVDFRGSQFTTSKNHMTPILNAINRRGLLYLDSNSSPRSVSTEVAAELNLASAKATLTLDERASRTEIDRRFAALEQRANREQRAIGIASPYPVSLERIAIWVRQLGARGIAIAPVSALTQAPASSKVAQ